MSTQPTLSKIDPAFIINRQGKPAVLYAGLLDLAHKSGLLHIAVTLVQAPNESNDNTAICHARTEFEGGRWFEDIGDASASSVGKMIIPHIIRMAATRAKARTLRDALNINGAAVEEYGPEEDDDTPAPRQQQRPPAAPPTGRAATMPDVPPDDPKQPATPQARKALAGLISELERVARDRIVEYGDLPRIPASLTIEEARIQYAKLRDAIEDAMKKALPAVTR